MDVTKRDILRRTIKDALTELSHTHPDLVDLFQAFLDLEEEAWKPPMWIVPNPTSPPHPLFPNPLLPSYPVGDVWPFHQSHSFGSSQQEFLWTTGYDSSGNPSPVMFTGTASSPIPPTLIPYDTVPEISEEEPAAADDDHDDDDDAGEMISQ